jgi:hypothetical protein
VRVGIQFVALLLGAGIVVAFSEIQRRARSRPAATRTVGDATADGEDGAETAEAAETTEPEVQPRTEPDWQRILAALRPVRERGWESPVGQPAEESWPLVLLTIFVGLVLGFAWLAGPWRIATFVIYLLLGIGTALTALSLVDWQRGEFLPPGGGQVIVRSALGCVASLVILAWLPNTTYRGLSAESMRAELIELSVGARPRALADEFAGPGIALVVSLAFATLAMVAVLLLAIVETASMRAMAAVGAGSRRRGTLWAAQFYRDRQPPLWGRLLVLVVLGFVLGAGVVLRLWDSTLGSP